MLTEKENFAITVFRESSSTAAPGIAITVSESPDSQEKSASLLSVVTESPYNKIVPLLGIVVCFVGMIFNAFIFDVSRKLKIQTTGSTLLRSVAIWDNIFLIHFIVYELPLQLFEFDLSSVHTGVCKIYKFLLWTTALNTSSHLVALAVDRAVSISNPTKSYGKNSKHSCLIISICLTFFNCTVVSSYLGIYKLQNGICTPDPKFGTFLKIHQCLLFTVFYTTSHFIAVCIASAVFVYKLRRHCTNSTAGPSSKKKCATACSTIAAATTFTRLAFTVTRESVENNDASNTLGHDGTPATCANATEREIPV